MTDSVTKRLKDLRERSGLSMAAIAREMGFRNASSYQRYEDAELFTRGVLPLHIVQKLAKILPGKGSPPITDEEVTMLAGLSRITGSQLRFIDEQGWVWCIGEVAAGRWREALEWPRDEWRPVAVAIHDERYPGAERRALRVAGDSMDQVYPDGSFVIFISLGDIGRKPQAGDRVVVVRRRHGLVEATVKEYHRDGQGKRWLLPRSSNPEHTPMRLNQSADESETTEILGLVVGSQRLE